MSTKIVLLICVFIYSKETFTRANLNLRVLLEKMNNVTRVRTIAELRTKGNELATLDFIGLVQQYDGYEAEEYDVRTEDGYILKLHRISGSPYSPKASNKSIVFMQHGFIGSSDYFVTMGPSHDLAYLLADEGYDIWLGNIRGNCYSRRHEKYLPTHSNYDFWKFTIDDLGVQDAPTFIDYVLEKTNKKKLIYIGHSMGNMMSFMLLSTKPQYNDKINLSISLAPAIFFDEPFTLFFKLLLTIIQPVVVSAGDVLRIYELFPLSKLVVGFAKTVCSTYFGKFFCGLILSTIMAFRNMNFNNISSIVAVAMNGASSNTATHICQLARTKKFRKFDFGSRLNREKYNLSEPPEYDLSKISAPQALFYADHDTFVHPKGVKKLKNTIKNVVSFEKVPENYKHLDFLWSKTARTDYYDKILKLVNKFS